MENIDFFEKYKEAIKKELLKRYTETEVNNLMTENASVIEEDFNFNFNYKKNTDFPSYIGGILSTLDLLF